MAAVEVGHLFETEILQRHARADIEGGLVDIGDEEVRLDSRINSRITSYNVCYTKLLRPIGPPTSLAT